MSSNNLTTIPLSDPSRELDYINRYNSRFREVRSGNYIGGSSVQKLEEKLCSFLGVKFALTLNLALML